MKDFKSEESERLDKILNRIFFYFLLFLFLIKNTVLINIPLSNIIFGGIILLFTILYIISYKLYNLKKYNLIFLTLLGLLMLQGFYLTYHHRFSYFKYFYDILRYLIFIGIFLFGKYAYNNISSKGLIKWFMILVFYHIITGYYSLLFGEVTIIKSSLRLSGEFGANIGQFGLLMGLCVILLIILIKYCSNIFQKSLMGILMLLTLVLLSYNNTMRIIASLVFAMFIYYVLYRKKYIYLIVLSVLVIALIVINKEIYSRLVSIFTSNYNVAEMSGTEHENSFQWRIMEWYLLITDWYKNYLFLGVGLGQQTALHGFITLWGEPYMAHSDFVKLLVETGLIGFPVVLFLYHWLYKFIKNNCNIDEFIIVFLYFFFCLLTGNTLFTNPLQIFIFLIGYLTMENKIVSSSAISA